jgi:hypothetical protein
MGLRFADLPELYAVVRGCCVSMRICTGSLVRFHTPRIHLELSYEWAYSMACSTSSLSSTLSSAYEIQPSDASLMVHVEWTSERG